MDSIQSGLRKMTPHEQREPMTPREEIHWEIDAYAEDVQEYLGEAFVGEEFSISEVGSWNTSFLHEAGDYLFDYAYEGVFRGWEWHADPEEFIWVLKYFIALADATNVVAMTHDVNPVQTRKMLDKALLRYRLDRATLGVDWESDHIDDWASSSNVFTLKELAALADMDEKSVRNATIQGSSKPLITRKAKVDGRTATVVEAENLRDWLSDRRSFQMTRIQSEPECQEWKHVVQQMSDTELYEKPMPEALLMQKDGDFSMYYAPFEHVNRAAKIVLVGITPGPTQARNAILTVQSSLGRDEPWEEALSRVRDEASFSGPLRANLVRMLDHFRINEWLGIASCNSLFDGDSHLVHKTSAIRFPVFYKGKPYNGTPAMVKQPMLRQLLLSQLGAELKDLDDSLIIPLGDKVCDALDLLIEHGVVEASRVLRGFQHPSPQNLERINYLIGANTKQPSNRVNTGKLDRYRADLNSQMNALIG